jgi:hypothetical protein
VELDGFTLYLPLDLWVVPFPDVMLQIDLENRLPKTENT